MKVIESLDEWYEALEANRLQLRTDGGDWIDSKVDDSACIGYVKGAINQGVYRWAPEQIKLVEWSRGDGSASLWMDEFYENAGELSYRRTGRTVIAEVITDGE